jgi:DHA3 family tetracycline resistance protein-like MFS transporter
VDTSRIYVRGAQLGWLAGALGIVASVPLAAAWGLHAPILVGGFGYLLMALVLVFVMRERHWSPAPRAGRSVFRSMGDTLSRATATIRIVPALLTILAISFVAGAGSEAFDRLRELHILSNFTLPTAPDLPVIAWFALINLVSLVASIGAVEVARRRIDTESHLGAARLMLALHVVLIAMVLAFGLAVSFEMAALSYLVTRIVRRVAMPIGAAWINLGLTSDVRATVHSMNSQADALGQIAGGPLLGWLAVAAASTRPAMLAVAVILAPSLYLYLRTIRLHGHDLLVDEVAS